MQNTQLINTLDIGQGPSKHGTDLSEGFSSPKRLPQGKFNVKTAGQLDIVAIWQDMEQNDQDLRLALLLRC